MQAVFIAVQTDTTGTVAALASSSSDGMISQVAFYMLIPFVIAFSFIFFIFYRQNRETQLRRKQLELELTALRAQMNPHFMFNCLGSIHHCIKNGSHDKAAEYLMKFSFLTRRVLENSAQRWISLKEDIEMLSAYLDLEQLRTENKFTYQIHVNEEIDTENVSVLMLLTQPFVENSIWHGFTNKVSGAHIDMHIAQHGSRLHYLIEDNGEKGENEKPTTDDGKRTSMGTALVRDQLRAIKEIEKGEADFTITDRLNEAGEHCGKRVTLYLPLLSLH